MKLRVVSWIVLALMGRVLGVHAEETGRVQVDIQQGELDRWSYWGRPSRDTEGRFWWSPERGGSGWLRVLDWQIGPLVASTARDGQRSWSPGTRLTSGYWGVAYDGQPFGAWAVQTPAVFETGVQWLPSLHGGSLGVDAVVGAGRRWQLDPTPNQARWDDQVRLGAKHAGELLSAELGLLGAFPEAGSRSLTASGRVGARWEGWEAGWVGSGSVSAPWTSEFTGGWRSSHFRAEAVWASEGWSSVRGSASMTLGTVDWGVRSEATLTSSELDTVAELSAAVMVGSGRASTGWAASSSRRGLEQKLECGWKTADFEAQGGWKVRGCRLGWLGPESQFQLTLAWLLR